MQTAGETVTLIDPTSASTTFNSPTSMMPMKLTFKLAVTDNEGTTSFDDINIEVQSDLIKQYTTADNKLSLTYPTLARHSFVQEEVVFNGIGNIISIALLSTITDPYKYHDTFTITVIENQELLNLDEWFTTNADPTGELRASGAFVHEMLDNGLEAYVLKNALPDGYEGGPVSRIFAIHQSTASVIVATLGHAHILGEISSGALNARDQLLYYIVESIQIQ